MKTSHNVKQYKNAVKQKNDLHKQGTASVRMTGASKQLFLLR